MLFLDILTLDAKPVLDTIGCVPETVASACNSDTCNTVVKLLKMIRFSSTGSK